MRWRFGLGGLRDVPENGVEQLLQVALSEVERLLARVEPCEPEQVADQPFHPRAVARDDLEEPSACPRRRSGRRAAPRRSREWR